MKNIFSLVLGTLISIFIATLFMPKSGDIEDIPTMNEFSTKVFQVGAYNDESSANEYAKKVNAKVVEVGGLYYVYLSILSDQENIEHMVKYLNDNNIYYYIKNIDVTPSFKEELVKYEELMKQTSSDIAFIELNKRIIELYEVEYED